MNKTILVTGGAGFIGSSLIDKLLLDGLRVICLDNFDDFYPRSVKENNLKSARLSESFVSVEGDIRNQVLLENIFKEHQIDLVVHLAAKAGVRPSIYRPKEYFDVNVNGTLNILEVMKSCGVNKLIFASSSSIYGNNIKIPYSETDLVDNPISPYAASKKSCELLIHTYHQLFDISVINLRFFTVYGPRQRPDLAIHKFFKNLYSNIPIEVYGDGNSSRDYTYVFDIVSGILKAIDYLSAHQRVYEIINIGNNTPVKLCDLIEQIEEITQRKFLVNKAEKQMGDMEFTYADISKAQTLLNYHPNTTLKDGLLWYKEWLGV